MPILDSEPRRSSSALPNEPGHTHAFGTGFHATLVPVPDFSEYSDRDIAFEAEAEALSTRAPYSYYLRLTSVLRRDS